MNPWEALEKKSVTDNIPIRGIVELTYQCNFSCVFCYLGDKRQEQQRLTLEQCETVFDRLRAAGALVLTFTVFVQPLSMTINREVIAEEIVRTLVGSLGLLAGVPLTSLIAAWFARGGSDGDLSDAAPDQEAREVDARD